MTERQWLERVDDAILNQVYHLSNLRQQPYRASIADFLQTSIENRAVCEGVPAAREEYDIWGLRIDRCNAMLMDPDDLALRRRVTEARAHQ